MRKVIEPQIKIGEIDISQVELNPRSRDGIEKILKGLQYLYNNKETRILIFKYLEKVIPPQIDKNTGRPGMDVWKIFVMGVVRMGKGYDLDGLLDAANNHHNIRAMMGHQNIDDTKYDMETLRRNMRFFTPEIIDDINKIIVDAGHKVVLKKGDNNLPVEINAKVDSYVVKSDVHFPTDLNLLWDAMRKIIILISRASEILDYSGWRQYCHNLKKIKKLFRKVSNLKHSTSNNEEKQKEREELIKEAYTTYINESSTYVEKAQETIKDIREGKISNIYASPKDVVVAFEMCNEIDSYIVHAKRQIDQIKRRVLNGEKIPHSEKIFSVFQEHVEWICKGKQGVPQELGLRLCIAEDQYGFILHHKVMVKETDDKIAVEMIWETKNRFPELKQCSMDKGFYSPENKAATGELIEKVIMPKKGRLNKKEEEEEYSEEFKKARRQHSRIESVINGLTHTGLNKCRDRGLDGHKRYVAFGVMTRNIFRLGAIILEKEEAERKRKEKYRRTWEKNRQHTAA